MQDPKQMMDDLFAMKMISGDFDKKESEKNDSGSDGGAPSGGHYPAGGNSGGRPSSYGGCLSALLMLPVISLVSLFKNLFS